jgi:hypothetical protein
MPGIVGHRAAGVGCLPVTRVSMEKQKKKKKKKKKKKSNGGKSATTKRSK